MNHTVSDGRIAPHIYNTSDELSSRAPTTEMTNERHNELSNQLGLHEPTRET